MTREAIGIDLGGTKILVGVVDEHRAVHHEEQLVAKGLDQEELLGALTGGIERARRARPEVVGAGLGVPCTLDREHGYAHGAVNLPITDLPIRDVLDERTAVPIFVDNDANVAALAEHRFGAGVGTDTMIMITVGTGIGGGLILGGQPYRGPTGAGAELGHTVLDLDGPPCQGSCPNRGCAEVMCSGTALAREGAAAAVTSYDSALSAIRETGTPITGRHVVEAALDGDALAVRIVREAGRRLGAAMSSWANIFEPQVIAVGGGVASGAGELLLEPARREMAARSLPPMNRRVRIVQADLGSQAGMVGAATMALEDSAAAADA